MNLSNYNLYLIYIIANKMTTARINLTATQLKKAFQGKTFQLTAQQLVM